VTSTTQTYAGEVVQVLAIRFTNLTISGQFGKEGPFGATLANGSLTQRSVDQRRDFSPSSQYAVGLTQMTEFFRQYFAIASQGHDSQIEGHYDQEPMTLLYEGASDIGVATGTSERWRVYPTSFPSYSRAIDEYAPMWQVSCEVYEAPQDVLLATQSDVLKQLSGTDADAFRPGIGYRPFNPFSDPFNIAGLGLNADDPLLNLSATQKLALYATAQEQADSNVDKLYKDWRDMIPAMDEAGLNKLLSIGGSMPINDDTSAYSPPTQNGGQTGKN